MKILLIEDNPGDARLVREILKEVRGNFTISVAEKLGLGLRLLASQDVDVVLMDLNLPDSNGLDTLTRLQAGFPHLPIVIMTSIDDEELAHQAVRLGAQDYLVKGSVNGELLRRILLYAIDRKRAEEALRLAHDELEVSVQQRTAELQEAQQVLSEVNKTLELKVSERTAELEAANASLQNSRRAALNLMEDSVAARKHAEETSVKLLREVAERKRTEEELKQSISRFELLTATAGELLQSTEPQKVVESVCLKVMKYLDCHAFFNFLVDEQAGKLHLNACAGIPDEEARRIEWLDFGVAVCGCVARDGDRIVAEHITTTPDERTELIKSYGINSYCCHPLLGPGGKILGTLSFGTCGRETFSEADLSLMKAVSDQVAVAMTRIRNEADVLQLGEDMAARNVDLEVVNKELESFIYSISHDLRAPIRSIAGFVKILVEDYARLLDVQGQDYLARIHNGAEKMSRLIEDLLYLSKISRQEVRRNRVDMSKMASAIVWDLREANPGRSVDVRIMEGLTAIGDQRLIEIVITNLLGNAWKFTSKTEKTLIEFGALEQDGKTVYYIRDNGAGFDPKYADKMFWPFHRLHSDKEFPGTGIGLTIVERIIHSHGGRVWAEGQTGKGAMVYFTLE